MSFTNIGQGYKYAAVAAVSFALGTAVFTQVVPVTAQSSVEARLQRLEDESQIRHLLIEYGHDLDTKEFVGYGNLFAKNGTWDGSLGLHKGPAAITAMLQNPTGGRTPTPFDPKNVQSFHVMTNIVIHVDGDRATAQSKWTFFNKGQDNKPVATLSGHYDDAFTREDGRWKFLSRVALHDIPS